MGEEFDVVQLVGLGHILLNAVELVLLHKAGEVQLHLEGAVLLIGTNHGVLGLIQDGAGGGVGGILIQNFKGSLHGRNFTFFLRGVASRGFVLNVWFVDYKFGFIELFVCALPALFALSPLRGAPPQGEP